MLQTYMKQMQLQSIEIVAQDNHEHTSHKSIADKLAVAGSHKNKLNCSITKLNTNEAE